MVYYADKDDLNSISAHLVAIHDALRKTGVQPRNVVLHPDFAVWVTGADPEEEYVAIQGNPSEDDINALVSLGLTVEKDENGVLWVAP